jgi:hypothetical protein
MLSGKRGRFGGARLAIEEGTVRAFVAVLRGHVVRRGVRRRGGSEKDKEAGRERGRKLGVERDG